MSDISSPTRAAVALSLVGLLLGGCGSLDRLSNVGKAPDLSAIQDPTAQPGYKPVRMPMPNPQPSSYAASSLWRTGSRAFFKDQRAQQVGDIVTVQVKVTDKANLDNETKRSRSSGDKLGVPNVLGIESKNLLPGSDPSSLISTNSTSSSEGTGSIARKEELVTNVAAVVTQVLPNGNLVVEGKQEIRVNFEVRELIVAGIIRPEDIQADNTVDSTKIAEARIAYGGRGQITDDQQPRYGQQVMDIILPF
jgi:flagellar L-ring protein precursor FlgH